MQNAQNYQPSTSLVTEKKPASGIGPDVKSILVYYLDGWITFGLIYSYWSRKTILTSQEFEILGGFAMVFGGLLPLIAWGIHYATLFGAMKSNPKADISSRICIAFMGAIVFAIPALLISMGIYAQQSTPQSKAQKCGQSLWMGGSIMATLGFLMMPSFYYRDISNFETQKAEQCVANWIFGQAQNQYNIQLCRDAIDHQVNTALLVLNPILTYLEWAIIVVGCITAVSLFVSLKTAPSIAIQ